MIISIPNELLDHIDNYLINHDFKNSFSQGNLDQNVTKIGLIGELVTHWYLFGHYQDLNKKPDGFDGGYDFIYNNEKIDVKTKSRTKGLVNWNYEFAVYAYQMKLDADLYIFTSYHTVEQTLEICGFLRKDEFLAKSKLVKKGERVDRPNNTFFLNKDDSHFIIQRDLNPINDLKEIINA